MKIGICDDDRRALPKLEQEIRYCTNEMGIDADVYTFRDEDNLLVFLNENSIDLLFMDIEMPGRGGIALADRVTEICPDCQIAFCTNYLEYVSDVYEVKHFYYVLKDDFSARLPFILRKMERIPNKESKIRITVNRETVLVHTKDILYIERNGRYSFITLIDGACLRTMKKMDEILKETDDPGMIRCHTSYIVSLDKVKKFSKQIFTMEDGTEIPVSRTYREKVRQAFLRWNWPNN